LDKKVNYYEILESSRGRKLVKIKSAYYKLSKAYHPDKNSDPEAIKKFQLITEAYEVLGNYDAKRNYDRTIYSGKFGTRHRDVNENRPPTADD